MMDWHLVDHSSAYRSKSDYQKKNRLIECIDTPLEQQVLDVAQRERVADLHHYRQADDLRACLEVL